MTERKELEESVEDVLSREGINCSIIDLRVLSGNIEDIRWRKKSVGKGALN